MITDFRKIYREDNGKDLFEWITLLSKFNKGKPLHKDLISEIESFFDFYWKNNRMRVFKSEIGLRYIQELPSGVSESIVIEFLFRDFLNLFKSIFNYKK